MEISHIYYKLNISNIYSKITMQLVNCRLGGWCEWRDGLNTRTMWPRGQVGNNLEYPNSPLTFAWASPEPHVDLLPVTFTRIYKTTCIHILIKAGSRFQLHPCSQHLTYPNSAMACRQLSPLFVRVWGWGGHTPAFPTLHFKEGSVERLGWVGGSSRHLVSARIGLIFWGSIDASDIWICRRLRVCKYERF